MATTPAAPSTPTLAIVRELRRLGLRQGRGKDFRVKVHGERGHTYVITYNQRTEEIIAARADEIEARANRTGFTFHVSVRYSDAGNVYVSVQDAGIRVRETAPTA